MRIQNSFAAAVATAVAAVVFSAAFQPAANATPIVIDSFTNQSTPSTISESSASLTPGQYLSAATPGSPSGSLFSTRSFGAVNVQLFFGPPGVGHTQSASFVTTTGTALTLSTAKAAATGTPPNILQNYGILSYSNPTPVNVSAYDSIKITKVGSSPGTSPFTGTINIHSLSGTFAYQVPAAQWFSNTTLDVPLNNTNFPGVDFTSLTQITLNSNAILDAQLDAVKNQAYSTSVTFTEIALVPEPTQLVSVAAVGAMFGAWRLRKLRRARPAAGEAIAG